MLPPIAFSHLPSTLTAHQAGLSPAVTQSSGERLIHPLVHSVSHPAAKKTSTVRPPTTSLEVERYIKETAPSMLTPAQKTSSILVAAIKREWQLDVEPDTARIATFNYNLDRPKPHNGRMLNSMTLTEAALRNVRSMNTQDERAPRHDELTTLINIGRFTSPLVDTSVELEDFLRSQDAHEYVLKSAHADTGNTPPAADRLPFTPQAFRDLVWRTELSAPYKSYLDTFWPAHQETYTQLSKLSFGASAQIQQQEGSLSNYEVTLAMRAAGLGSHTRLEDMTVAGVKAPYVKDPNVETGLLSISGAQSTDLIYVTDKQPRLNAKGKRIHHTLLYIPGNSSPIHRFDSVSQMKTWLADQAADPGKRAVLATHFKKNDQDDKTFSDGVKQSLTGLGGWTQAQRPNAWGFTSLNAWDPQTYITTHPVDGDPFHVMSEHQKNRAYADADHDIVTDRDVTKKRIVSVVEAAGAAALMLTPLAMVMPEVALAMDATYLAAGVAEMAVGIDDAAHGKSTGTDRIVFGLLNAAPTLVHGAAKLPGVVAGLEGERALVSVPSTTSPPVEFKEIAFSGEQVPDHQVIELAGDERPNGGVKRTRLDEAQTEGTEDIKRSKPADEVRDLKKINDLIFTFVDTYNGAERLNIVAHGALGDSGTADLVLGEERLGSDDLLQMLWDNNVPTDEYANIRLLMCNSGTGGEESFAAQFQRDVGVPVKAYGSKVNVEFNLDELAALFDPARGKNKLTQFEGVLPASRRHRVTKIKPEPAPSATNERTEDPYKDFSYKPMHFPDRAENPKPDVMQPSMPTL